MYIYIYVYDCASPGSPTPTPGFRVAAALLLRCCCVAAALQLRCCCVAAALQLVRRYSGSAAAQREARPAAPRRARGYTIHLNSLSAVCAGAPHRRARPPRRALEGLDSRRGNCRERGRAAEQQHEARGYEAARGARDRNVLYLAQCARYPTAVRDLAKTELRAEARFPNPNTIRTGLVAICTRAPR